MCLSLEGESVINLFAPELVRMVRPGPAPEKLIALVVVNVLPLQSAVPAGIRIVSPATAAVTAALTASKLAEEAVIVADSAASPNARSAATPSPNQIRCVTNFIQ